MTNYEQGLFEAVPCGIVHCTLGETPSLIRCNSACVQIFGYDSKEEFERDAGDDINRLVYSYDVDFLRRYLRRAEETGAPTNFGHRIQRKDGTIGYIMGTFKVTNLDDGSQVMEGIFRDSGEHITQADIRKSIYYRSVKAASDKKKIIVAATDQSIRDDIVSAIEDEYCAIDVSTQSEIRSVLKREEEDIEAIIISSDILVENGYSFIASLRGSILYATVPIIALAVQPSNGVDVSTEELLSFGVNEVIYPPYNVNVIHMRLANLIELKNTSVQKNAIETLMDNLSGGVIIFRVEKNSFSQFYYTKGVLALAGIDRNQAETITSGGQWSQIIYEKDARRLVTQLREAAAEEEPLEMTFRVKQKDNGLSWVHMHGTPVKKDEEGTVYQCIVSPTSSGEKLYMNVMNDSFNAIMVYGETCDDLLYFNNGAVPLLKENLLKIFDKDELTEEDYVQKQILLPKGPRHLTLNGRIIDWNGIKAKIIYVTDDTDSYRMSLERHQLYEVERSKIENRDDQMLFSAVFNVNKDELLEFGIDKLLSLEVNKGYSISKCAEILSELFEDETYAKDVRENCNAKRLLEEYMNRETKRTLQCRIRRIDGGYTWVAINRTLVENPVTLELYAFLYVYDIDLETVRGKAFARILSFEEEYVGCLDLAKKTVRVMIRDDCKEGVGEEIPFDRFREDAWKDIKEEEWQELMEATDIENLKASLEVNSVHNYTYRTWPGKEERRLKSVRVFYLDERRDIICFTRTDVTKLYEQQQEQNDRLQAALSEAEQASKAKSMFLSRMSHDIRTPMNAILGMSRLALESKGEEEEITGYLEKIQASGSYLLGLINDILDMSRIESDRIQLVEEPCSLKSCVDFVLVTLKMQIEEKSLNVVYEEECTSEYVMLDKLRMQQIFFNLISNAVKFSNNNGNVTVKVNMAPKVDNKCATEILVIDEGIGIAPEDEEKIFEAFEQGDNQGATRLQGTGLGLAIVKNLVGLMGGAITVASTLGEGTTFRVSLPLRAASVDEISQKEEEKNLPGEYDFTGVRILIVEDNAINMEIAKRTLEDKKCIVTEAFNGQEAIDILGKSVPGEYDLVLMDVQMPVMDGISATKEIRHSNREDIRTIPIVAMTANAFSEDVEKCKKAGMNAHVVKPVDVKNLYKTIYTLLYAGRQDREDESN